MSPAKTLNPRAVEVEVRVIGLARGVRALVDVELGAAAGLDQVSGVKSLVAVDLAVEDGSLFGGQVVKDALAAQGLVALAQHRAADDPPKRIEGCSRFDLVEVAAEDDFGGLQLCALVRDASLSLQQERVADLVVAHIGSLVCKALVFVLALGLGQQGAGLLQLGIGRLAAERMGEE